MLKLESCWPRCCDFRKYEAQPVKNRVVSKKEFPVSWKFKNTFLLYEIMILISIFHLGSKVVRNEEGDFIKFPVCTYTPVMLRWKLLMFIKRLFFDVTWCRRVNGPYRVETTVRVFGWGAKRALCSPIYRCDAWCALMSVSKRRRRWGEGLKLNVWLSIHFYRKPRLLRLYPAIVAKN